MMQQMMSNPEMFSQVMQMHNQMQQSEGGEGGGMAMPDPQIMAQMMQNPVYQQMMQQMMSNPQVIEQVMRNHPLLASNPNAAEVARQSTQMMQGEEFRQLMSNPEALGAMMQIQQGMMRLQATSPGVLSASG
jgi:ubiquilin